MSTTFFLISKKNGELLPNAYDPKVKGRCRKTIPSGSFCGPPPDLTSKSLLPYSSFLSNSPKEVAIPASPWISEGMIILVAFPSAAFSKASRLFN